MAGSTLKFEDNVGLVHLQAKIGYRWARQAGVLSVDYEDMFQEASLAFLVAVEGYNPERGYTFSAYYTRAAFSHFSKAIGRMTGVKNLNGDQRGEIADRRAENKRRAQCAIAPLPDMSYGLAPVNFGAITTLSGDAAEPYESQLVCDDATPEERAMFSDSWRKAVEKLSPLASLMLDWLRDPPPELQKELEMQMIHANVCVEHGKRGKKVFREGLTLTNIGNFLIMIGAATKREILLAEKELMEVINELEAV